MSMKADLFLDAGATLAEGPVWDDVVSRLLWVDIPAGHIHRTAIDGRSAAPIEVGEDVGAVVLVSDGRLLAATRSGIRLIDPAQDHPLLAALPGDEAGTRIRMNDGKCDPRGRFVVGTKADDDTPGAGTLWRFDGNPLLPVLTGVTISNGLAWSDDGTTLYYVDTPTGRIDRFDYDPDTGTVDRGRTEVEIPAEQGAPDGLAIDRDGGLWVALWGGAAVHRYEHGTLTAKVSVSATYVTSCTFGGHGLDTLFITSAEDRDTGQLGAIHVVEPGVRGHTPGRFDARALAPSMVPSSDEESTATNAPPQGRA